MPILPKRGVATVHKGGAIKQKTQRVRRGLPPTGRSRTSRNNSKSVAGRGDAEKRRGGTEKITYRILPAKSWSTYGRAIVAIERSLFPKKLQEKPAELRDVFENPKAIFIVAMRGREVCGFACGEDLWHYVYPEDPEFDSRIEADGTTYVETLDVKKECQGLGIGTGLLEAFIAEAKRRGYRHVAGHYRAGASVALAEKLKGRVRSSEDDYAGSGETYSYIIIDIKK